MPMGASSVFQGGRTTVLGSAIATRVTLTVVPCTANSQMGAVAGPRLVSTDPVVSRAPVIRKDTQSGQSCAALALISVTACCAEITRTVLVAPPCHRTSPSAGAAAGTLTAAGLRALLRAPVSNAPPPCGPCAAWPLRAPQRPTARGQQPPPGATDNP